MLKFLLLNFIEETTIVLIQPFLMSKAAIENNVAPFEALIYVGEGQNFFKAGEGSSASKVNKIGRENGLKRLKEILFKI